MFRRSSRAKDQALAQEVQVPDPLNPVTYPIDVKELITQRELFEKHDQAYGTRLAVRARELDNLLGVSTFSIRDALEDGDQTRYAQAAEKVQERLEELLQDPIAVSDACIELTQALAERGRIGDVLGLAGVERPKSE